MPNSSTAFCAQLCTSLDAYTVSRSFVPCIPSSRTANPAFAWRATARPSTFAIVPPLTRMPLASFGNPISSASQAITCSSTSFGAWSSPAQCGVHSRGEHVGHHAERRAVPLDPAPEARMPVAVREWKHVRHEIVVGALGGLRRPRERFGSDRLAHLARASAATAARSPRVARKSSESSTIRWASARNAVQSVGSSDSSDMNSGRKRADRSRRTGDHAARRRWPRERFRQPSRRVRNTTSFQ